MGGGEWLCELAGKVELAFLIIWQEGILFLVAETLLL